MKNRINNYFRLDEKAHHYFHYCKTENRYFTLPKVIHYTILASLYNAFIDSIIDDTKMLTNKGNKPTKKKIGAIVKARKTELILFAEKVNELYCTKIRISDSRRFWLNVNKYDKHGYSVLIDGRTGNQNAKLKTVNPRIENLKQLYLQGFTTKELSKLTGYSASTIDSYRKRFGWAKVAKWENGNRRNTKSKLNKNE